MKKFIPLGILLLFIYIISFAIYNLNQKQNIEGQENLEQEASSDNDNSKSDLEEDINFISVKLDLPEFSLPELYDKSKDFSKKDLKGKYTIINFFASWCSTCHAEHDILLKIQSEAIADLYGISWRDIDENTIKYLQQSGNPFAKIGVDSKGIFTKIANIEAVPETWLVNPKGEVVLRLKGNLQEFSVDEIKRYIRLH